MIVIFLKTIQPFEEKGFHSSLRSSPFILNGPYLPELGKRGGGASSRATVSNWPIFKLPFWFHQIASNVLVIDGRLNILCGHRGP